MTTKWLGDQGSRGFWSIVGYAVTVIVLVWFLNVVGFLGFRRYQPPRGTAALEQLVASLPETLKFALVEQGGRSYIVWIGRSRGVIVSGPPVYVFDSFGTLVDFVGDSGESDNKLVLGLYAAAIQAPGIAAQEAVTLCRHRRTGPTGSP